MPANTVIRFNQSCPTCGRRVQVRASLLGSTVACQHCKAEFTATGMEGEPSQIDDNCRLMARVERALQSSGDSASPTTV
ncbi:MAG: response regulator [Pirellulaceae bacterium]